MNRPIDDKEFQKAMLPTDLSPEVETVRQLDVGEAVALSHSTCGTRKLGCAVVNRIYQDGLRSQRKFSTRHSGDELFVKRIA